MINEAELLWISSNGGPLVLLQESAVPFWEGALGEDYEIAGAIPGYTGILTKNGRDVLVLADEPLATAYYERGGERFLVGWSAAPDAQSVMQSLASVNIDTMESVAETAMEISEGRQFLMDAASPGEAVDERLLVSLPPGSYRIRTFIYRPSTEIELVIHAFSAAGSTLQ